MKITGVVALGIVVMGLGVSAVAQKASQTDKDFVAKESQGGMYEVEAGKVAAMRGQSPVVRDFGVLESHDHALVGAELKKTAAAGGVTFSPKLNAEFSERLAKLKATPAVHFDTYYLNDMKDIHEKDEAAFEAEAKDGTAGFQKFAEPTAVLVAAHLGWLGTL